MSLIRNDRVGYDYEILEKFEAGLALLGTEVKSLRKGNGSLRGARILVRGSEAFLIGATIPPWQVANAGADYDPIRPRKLLLKPDEIAQVLGAETADGLTVVPISVYNKGRNLKLELAIVRGKKNRDKRETIKKRDTKRAIDRALKNQ
jgi:SsrA-binding protein